MADAQFVNTGTVRVELSGSAVAHTLSLAGGGQQSGTVQLAAGTSVELGGATTLQNGAIFAGSGATVVAGLVTVAGNVSASNLNIAVGELNVGGNVLTAGLSGRQSGGTARIGTGGTLRLASGGAWIMDDGLLTGTGTLEAALTTQGTLAPGSPIGPLGVTGATQFGEDAHLTLELAGSSAGTFDTLTINGQAFLDGRISISLANGFVPSPSATFQVLTAFGGIAGTFLNAPTDGQRFNTSDGVGSFQIQYRADSVLLTAFVPEPSPAVLTIAGAAAALSTSRRVRRPAD